jgi:hypothetical protein
VSLVLAILGGGLTGCAPDAAALDVLVYISGEVQISFQGYPAQVITDLDSGRLGVICEGINRAEELRWSTVLPDCAPTPVRAWMVPLDLAAEGAASCLEVEPITTLDALPPTEGHPWAEGVAFEDGQDCGGRYQPLELTLVE